MDQLTAHQHAQDAFGAVLARVTADQLSAPTPCSEWTVAALVEHVVAGNARLAGTAAEAPPPGDLVAAHARSAAAAQAVFAAPEGLSRTFELPFGSVPGSVLIGMRTTDLLTHAWDLARATGQPTDLDPELAAEVLEAAHQRVGDGFRGAGKPFGAEQPCGADRPAADRLAAFLGRSVD